jgi:nitrogen fixation protein FixH
MKRSFWRFFPLAVIAGLGLVVVVNAGLVYAALHGFPGQAGDEGFALSNHYDAVLEREQREAALGWTVVARTDAAGRPEVRLADRDGSPLRGASVAASAERPLGAPETRLLEFHEFDAGSYIADAPLPMAGQWELTLSASVGGHDIAATRRVIVH